MRCQRRLRDLCPKRPMQYHSGGMLGPRATQFLRSARTGSAALRIDLAAISTASRRTRAAAKQVQTTCCCAHEPESFDLPAPAPRSGSRTNATRVATRRSPQGCQEVLANRIVCHILPVGPRGSDLPIPCGGPSKCHKYPTLATRKLRSTRGRSDLLFICC
jgi:hypothetical protein